ncbi:MAG: peptidoglycan-binding protein [Methyloceanibacter sp.]
MAFGDDIVALARKHVGEQYRLGARARFLEPAFKGPWDCAEFVTWVIFQASGERVLLGCLPREPARGDAYTGHWVDDARKYGLIVSLDTALKTAGAVLLRGPARKRLGHIAISVGDGRNTVEAYDRNHGVIRGKADPQKRGWDHGVRVPDPAEWAALVKRASVPENWFLRATTAPRSDPRVEVIQQALKQEGVKLARIDGRFTPTLATKVAKYQDRANIVVDGMVGPQTLDALAVDWSKSPAPTGVYNDKYGVYFDSLVPGGFFSHDPDDLKVKRSIRSNNPGALNYSTWQTRQPGYVGLTPPDNSRNRNRTVIYRTPEHGVAAWFVLLSEKYGFGTAGRFSLAQLARKYAGRGASQAEVDAYVRGWSRASGGRLNADSTFRPRDTGEMLSLAEAMFAHEIGGPSPLSDAQIRYGIDTQRDNSMPA